jgi:glucan phosphoethanolaminetransferase (alkaline phosphatase superfamily)
MTSYFTILHILALAFFFLLFVVLLILSLKETRKKVLAAMIFSNVLVVSMLAVFSMFVIDKYTKKAKLENVTQTRVLITESFVLSGVVRNIGKFDISKCYLNVKLVNNAVTGSS